MFWEILAIVFLLFGILMIILYRRLNIRLKKVQFDKSSLSVKYGKMSEQFMPFLKEYPYDENNFRFLGTPVDGVQFENDKIIFIEFKTGDSKLSAKQKNVKQLIEDNKIEFREIRIR